MLPLIAVIAVLVLLWVGLGWDNGGCLLQQYICFLKCCLKLLLSQYRANGLTQELLKASIRAKIVAERWSMEEFTAEW